MHPVRWMLLCVIFCTTTSSDGESLIRKFLSKSPSYRYKRTLLVFRHCLLLNSYTKALPSKRQLLLNAFRLVKDGGIVVYSTCSFCKAQNEDVVAWLLDKEQSAVLVPIEFASLRQWYQSRNCEVPSHLTPAEEGTLPCTLRFYPKRTGTSGMFIAKIMKQPKKTQN
jgi:16S rRNA C967 or C1407 C5-methylase (RsmB/RsmF family)